ncbi:GtrA family protein [Aquitalea magnusonii]|uniref:GtrA family protein n=1 Tax=Aquitalea magnusonii TaxID=332411 RepID=UPI0007506A10
MVASLNRLAKKKGISTEELLRYVLVGGGNTIFAYVFTVVVYYLFQQKFHIVLIVIFTNIVCITVSFFTNKFLVFRSKSHWFLEYLRCYVVYGGSTVLGIAGLWLLVSQIGIPFWIAQAGLMVISVVFSYVGHRKFTFKSVRS